LTNNTSTIKKILTPYEIGHTKIRIGPNEDGGYVISRNCLEKTDFVYSLGIGENCGFDVDLANKGYKVFQYESEYEVPFVNHENFVYKKMSVSGDNFATEVISNGHQDKNLMLSMDIEGGEYELILKTPSQILNNFNQIVFEIHDVLYNPDLENTLKKISENFILIHIHANNNCLNEGAYGYGIEDEVPNILELTYVNRKFVSKEPTISRARCPHPKLDFKNHSYFPEVSMKWWTK
jgi:hypothetical protein